MSTNVPLYTATPAQQASLEDLEQQAVQNTITDHDLASSDTAAAETWGRDASESELWALLVQAINTPAAQQTMDQANAVAWLSSVVQQQNIVAADDAGLEYAKWAGLGATAYQSLLQTDPSEATLQSFLSGDPLNYTSGESGSTPESASNEGYCLYEPPAPDSSQYTANIYTNGGENADQTCFTPCTDILTDCPPNTPPESQFVAWGTADADEQSFNNSAFPAVSNDVAEAIGFGAAVTGAGSAAAALGLSPAFAAAIEGTSLAAALTPFGGVAPPVGVVLSADELAEVAAGVAAADVAAVVGVVLTAIAAGVIEGFNIVSAAEVPVQLAQMISAAPTTPPNLVSMLQSQSSTTELYELFIGSTLPEPTLATCDNSSLLAIGGPSGQVNNPAPCLNAPAIPAASASDPTFNITEKGASTSTTSGTLDWTDSARDATDSAYVVGSWFVNTETSGSTSLTEQTLDIHYTNWSGDEELAWLTYSPTTGYQFVTYAADTTPPIDPSTCQSDGTCSVSSSIEYISGGNDYSAALTGTYIPAGDTGVSTTTSLTVSPSSPVVNQQVTLTATISDSAATGTVNFTDGSNTLCANVPVVNQDTETNEGDIIVIGSEAIATCSKTFSSPGTHDLSASYSGGPETGGGVIIVIGGSAPATWDEGSQGALSLDVTNPVPTSTTVSASPSSPVVGEPINFTATVSDVGGPTPGGTMTFSDGNGTLCSDVALSAGTAACSQYYQSTGPETVTASYSGDSGTEPSSGRTTVTVGQASSSTSVSVSPAAPVVGQQVTYTAVVAGDPENTNGPAPTGSVTFSAGGANLCVDPLSSTLTCTQTYEATGNYSVTAAYSGDNNTHSSSGQASVSVSQAATGTSVSTTSAKAVVGQPATFTAAISARAPELSLPPTGNVTFMAGASTLCKVALSPSGTASCSYAFQAPGNETVSAAYSGDNNYVGSSGATTLTVNQAATTTALSGAPGSLTFGQAFTLNAQVAPAAPSTAGPAPTGTVTFDLDGQQLGAPVTLAANGQAQSLSITDLAPGAHNVSATYSGDGNYQGSSTASTETVTCSQTITSTYNGTLSVSKSTCVEGGTISGPVNVQPGGTLALIGAKVNGPITTTGTTSALVCGTTVQGPVTMTNGAGPVAFGGPAGSSCSADNVNGPLTISGQQGPVSLAGITATGPVTLVSATGQVNLTGSATGPLEVTLNSGAVNMTGDTVNGPLVVSFNTGSVYLDDNTVSGPATVSSNTSSMAPVVESNTVSGPLACSTNTPAPTDAGGLNKVSGPSSGQCAKLG